MPYADPSTMDDVYDDAVATADDYPAMRLPQQAVIDRLAAEARWHEICEEISAHGSLMRPFLD